jgi:hypothetical protein
MKIKKKYRGLFNKKYAIDRKIIRLLKKGKLDASTIDLDTKCADQIMDEN